MVIKMIARRIMSLLSVCFVCLWLVRGSGGVPRALAVEYLPPADVLTVNQTLGLVFGTPVRPDFNQLKRANPDAVEPVRKVLENPDLAFFHPTAYRVIGHIGDAADIAKLEVRLHSFVGVLNDREREVITAMFDAVGLSSGRKVSSADKLARKMLTAAYWDQLKFRWYDPVVKTEVPFAYECLIRFLFGYALSRDPQLAEQLRQIRKGIPDEPTLIEFDLRANQQKLLSSVAERYRVKEKFPTPESLERFFNQDLANPGLAKLDHILKKTPAPDEANRSVVKTDQVSDIEQQQLVGEAAKFYQSLVDDLLAGKEEVVFKHFLDDGRPIAAKKRVDRLEFSADLARTKALIAKVRSIAGPSIFPRAEIRREALNNDEVQDVVLVTFQLSGTNSLGSNFRHREGSVATVAANGNLVVVMKRIKGQWYWNPFGW